MTEVQHMLIFQSFLGMGVLLFAYAYMYRKTHIDRFREDMFTVRDKLFDYIWQHGLSYDLPAYRLTRDTLNGAIRVADRISIPLFVFLCFHRERHNGKGNALADAISDIENDTVRAHFEEVRDQVGARLLKYLFLEGPQWLVFKPIILASRYAVRFRKWGYKMIYAPVDLCNGEFTILGRKNSLEARLLQESSHLTSSTIR